MNTSSPREGIWCMCVYILHPFPRLLQKEKINHTSLKIKNISSMWKRSIQQSNVPTIFRIYAIIWQVKYHLWCCWYNVYHHAAYFESVFTSTLTGCKRKWRHVAANYFHCVCTVEYCMRKVIIIAQKIWDDLL